MQHLSVFAIFLLTAGCDSSSVSNALFDSGSVDGSVDATSDSVAANPCPRSVASYCEAGVCVLDWSQAPDASAWCKAPQNLPGDRVGMSDGVCEGTHAVFVCGTDVCNVYEYDAVTGKLVAVVVWDNAMDKCLASDLPAGHTPMVGGEIVVSAPPGPRCSWADGGTIASFRCISDGGVIPADASGD